MSFFTTFFGCQPPCAKDCAAEKTRVEVCEESKDVKSEIVDMSRLVPLWRSVYKRENIPESTLEMEGTSSSDLPHDIIGGQCAPDSGDVLDARWCEDVLHVTYLDGTTYIGEIKDGKRHGFGVWKGHNGQYEGHWIDDRQHGKGCQTWDDGRVYDGEFSCRKFSGLGRMVWKMPTGDQVYEGSYLNDLRHGIGKFEWADGRNYEGQWVKGQRHGQGVYTNRRKEKLYGTWANDKFVQPPKIRHSLPTPATEMCRVWSDTSGQSTRNPSRRSTY